MEVLHLKSLELPHKTISHIAGITGNTVRTYLREYVSGGLDKVQEINFYRSESDLQDYKSNVCELHSFLRITSKIAPREFRCSNYSCFGQCTVSKM